MRTEIIALQEEMKKQGVDYYLIPSEDDHSSEYVAPYYRLRELFSGFTGSAGSLLVTAKEAFLWTDGRYFIQAEAELADSGITLMKSGEPGVPTILDWLVTNAQTGEVFAYDGKKVSAQDEQRFQNSFSKSIGITVAHKDLADTVAKSLGTRKEMEYDTIYDYDVRYAGKTREEKCQEFRDFLAKEKIEYYVVSALDEIAWLLNIRGNDVACNPVCMAYVIATKEAITLYANCAKLEDGLEKKLEKANVKVKEYDAFYDDFASLKGCCADINKVNANIYETVIHSGGTSVASPLARAKAIKNETEIKGERLAHKKDAVAMVNFLHWLKHLSSNRRGDLLDENGEIVTEISAALRLEEERKKMEGYVEPSFDPIVAVGEHGAIVHYSADEKSNSKLTKGTFVLMDTGSQFVEGTTDITRTIALGEITARMKELYTMVLLGHMELLHTTFAKGCRGENLDIIARKPLWERGYDFNHGTGHGVGCFLNVHEGPVSIRSKIFDDRANSAVFEPGMITSNEPGVYIEGEFGIRLENMMVCVEKAKSDFAQFYGFEPLTLVPFDRDAIEIEMLNETQKEWINQYNQLIYETIGDEVEDEVQDWLFEITRPIY